jgi:FMN reductase
MDTQIKILGLGGSLRPGSASTAAVKIAITGAQQAGAMVAHIDLAAYPLPIFNGSYEIDAYRPKQQKAIRGLMAAAAGTHGILLASPTYHNTISGAVKNALDLMEIFNEDGPPRWAGKVVGLITVQGGSSGTGVNTLTSMLLAARALGAWVAPTMVSVPGSRAAFGENGTALDGSIHRRLLALGAEVTRASALFAGLGAAATLPEIAPAAGQAIPAIVPPVPG